MSKLKDDVAAYFTLAKRFGADVPRVPLTTEEAVVLALEMNPAELRHAEKVIAHARVFASISTAELPILRKHKARVPGEEEFWSAFHGEPFEGGEIVRRRA